MNAPDHKHSSLQGQPWHLVVEPPTNSHVCGAHRGRISLPIIEMLVREACELDTPRARPVARVISTQKQDQPTPTIPSEVTPAPGARSECHRRVARFLQRT